ncbi:MAG: hypothetical protein AAB225_07535 [Acidobacteriota bacterium]
MSQAEVFIIESLDFEDEKAQRFEGRIISDILAMSGKTCAYYYIRTKRELAAILKQFSSSKYRYLHLSCHGGGNCLHTTLDRIPFSEFGEMTAPHLDKRRLFISACSVATRTFADQVMPGTGCYSILGPAEEIYFSDAAVLWASFYHVMFRADSTAMRYDAIKAKAQEVANMYRVRLTLFDHHSTGSKPYRMKQITPQKEPQ